MGAVQMMCARIGMVTGRGPGGRAASRSFPRWLIFVAARRALRREHDQRRRRSRRHGRRGGDAHGRELALCSWCSSASAIAWATIRFRYHQIANILKWLALSLFRLRHHRRSSCVRTGAKSRSDTFIPTLPAGHEAWGLLVAILGTTISPYLFFWQASQEVEEEKAMGRRMLVAAARAQPATEIRQSQARRRRRHVLRRIS